MYIKNITITVDQSLCINLEIRFSS